MTRYLSVRTGSASKNHLTDSLSWQFPPFSQLLLLEDFHQQCASSPMVCQHNTPHCLPFGPFHCIDILILILILFSITNNSPSVTVPKALLSSKETKPAELPLSRKLLILSTKRDQVSLAQSTHAAFYLIFHCVNQCKAHTTW